MTKVSQRSETGPTMESWSTGAGTVDHDAEGEDKVQPTTSSSSATAGRPAADRYLSAVRQSCDAARSRASKTWQRREQSLARAAA